MMILVASAVAWLALCALWPYWATMSEYRVTQYNPFGPMCRACRGTGRPSRPDISYDDVLHRTCEGALLFAVHSLRRACSCLGEQCPCADNHGDTHEEQADDETELADLARSYVTHRRFPWLLSGIVRHFSTRTTAGEIMLAFGPPVLLSAVLGTVVLTLAT